MLKNCLYCLVLLFSLLSIPILIYTKKNNEKKICKNIIKIDVTSIVCLFINSIIMPENLCIYYGFGIFNIYIVAFIGGILYCISIFSNLVKIKNSETDKDHNGFSSITGRTSVIHSFITICIVTIGICVCLISIWRIASGWKLIHIHLFIFIAANIYSIFNLLKNYIFNSNKIWLIHAALLILPILFLPISILSDKYLINNSNLILVYYSRGNGGFGDGKTFTYAIGENFCKQFDLGSNGYYLENFLPENVTEISNINEIKNYNITFKENSILVYKDGNYICKERNRFPYFNIEFEKGFYIDDN